MQDKDEDVTILILIDGFLQSLRTNKDIVCLRVTILILIDGFLQYGIRITSNAFCKSHNPYFNRWFSAITVVYSICSTIKSVTILILIDGFLQYQNNQNQGIVYIGSQSLF